ncbi:c-type cytochrome [Methylibium sp.]|uniref:SorU family sulfite dehydrogenase c-type cytochrome subunit n=1 Tax=Methylibium sp. TaxID=2067992 RepID=UPI003D145CBB
MSGKFCLLSPHGACCILATVLAGAPALAADVSAQLKIGKALFTKDAVPACAVCHTLKDAGAAGAVGPVLDELRPDASRVAAALRNGLGQMPSYKGKLDDSQIAALAAYVASATGAGN